ncbi:pantetheine-phosphate adenylyltransferase [Pseudooceanicola atlanticus]|jgi:pantetheine-phosphate adenylyltransferase|uniref:Phosphopantetheine adenylyltransferase n=1 Tax=Pseudooceanicola atlanticus TaxID=1461694 RepID=A0A0A0ED92_9RHOB|nr:pantetheine-phosphate adenylyltransferase [Pseudooceanicola atlanticus]KGM48270.1 phosphopantetheine adenylyltransferase [Pseudooceanicola atlanticus]
MRIGLYPGTFDPITLGHVDIIRRASALVDRLVIGVAINRDKGPLFSLEERVAMIEAECDKLSEMTGTEIVAHPFENLLIHCARDVGASIIVRGLRAVADFEYEYQMVGMNRSLDSKVETVFLMADAKHQAIASKLVKEICRLDGDVQKFVTPAVNDKLRAKLGK